jgi:two-component system nitrogen regulation response regulator GlnG/two-component system response regulator HydG
MHLLAGAVSSMPTIERFFESHEGRRGAPRIDCPLVEVLVRHSYSLHVRELERFLWVALASSPGNFLALTPEVRDAIGASTQNATPNQIPAGGSGEIDRARIESALASVHGNITEAAQKLGLKNRFALYRLMKKFGIASAGEDENE